MSAARNTARRFLRAFWSNRAGAATLEFIIVMPMIIYFIFSYIEVGTLATRVVMLERGLDIAVRDLRLGAFPTNMNAEDTHDLIKDRVCENAFLLYSCSDVLLLELTAIPVGAALPTTLADCRDRTSDVDPVITIDMGDRATADSEIMLVRACIVVDPIFPGTGVGAGLPLDGSGGYRISAQTAFLNEPE